VTSLRLNRAAGLENEKSTNERLDQLAAETDGGVMVPTPTPGNNRRLQQKRLLDEGAGRQLLHADLAAADTRAQTAGLERVRLRVNKLASRVDRRQPVAELVGEVMTAAACAVALDEWSRTEVFQARPGTGQ